MKKIFTVYFIFLTLNSISQTFIKNIGNIDVNDGATSIVKSKNGYIIAGYNDRDMYLSEVNENGKLLWKDIYHITEQIDLITDIKYIDEKIIGCGYGYYEGTGNFLEFYFKYDIVSKSFDWIKKSKLILKPATIQILPNGNFLMTGDEIYLEEFKVFLMEIDANSGSMKKYKAWVYSGNESASSALIYNENIYIGGRYALQKKNDKYRGAISKFSLNFNEKWTYYYLNAKEKYLRNYLNKLIIDNNEIISVLQTNNHGIGNYYTLTMAKQTIEGDLVWAKEFNLDGFDNITVKDIKAVNDGYIIFGHTILPSEELFLIKTDKEGSILWSKIFGEDLSDNVKTDQGNFMEIDQQYIYIIGQSKNLNKNKYYSSILLKLNIDGTSDMQCWGKDVTNRTRNFENLIQERISLSGNDSIFINNNLGFKKNKIKKDIVTSSYYCFPNLAEDDIDTVRSNIVLIDFKKNDIIPTEGTTVFKVITDPLNATIKMAENKIIYTRKDSFKCLVDSFKYILNSSTNGIDTATVFIYSEQKSKDDNVKEFIMPENNLIELTSNYSENATYLWNNGKKTQSIIVERPGNYFVNVTENNCIYHEDYFIKENPYSFENIAKTNITFLLDASISMNRENRLPVLKRALYIILNFMREEDKLSVINYSNDAQLIFDGVEATKIDTIKSKINSLNTQGNSNIKDGIKMAYKTILNNFQENGNNRIIFTTDGNITIEKQQELISLINKETKKNISFSIFLFNDATLFKTQLQKVANEINGNLYIINPENVEQILLKEFKAVRK